MSIKIFSAAIAAVMSLTFLSLSQVARSQNLAENNSSKIEISGAQLKASEIVLVKFTSDLSKKRNENELGSFLSHVENYDIIISNDNNSFLFHIKPKIFHGRLLNGGVSDYTVRKSDYQLVEVSRSK